MRKAGACHVSSGMMGPHFVRLYTDSTHAQRHNVQTNKGTCTLVILCLQQIVFVSAAVFPCFSHLFPNVSLSGISSCLVSSFFAFDCHVSLLPSKNRTLHCSIVSIGVPFGSCTVFKLNPANTRLKQLLGFRLTVPVTMRFRPDKQARKHSSTETFRGIR